MGLAIFMNKKYYKIVHSRDNSYYSVIYSPQIYTYKLKDYILEYKINEWTYPAIDGSNLMCFDSLLNVQNFIINNDLSHYKVFECDVISPNKKGIFVSLINYNFSETLLKLINLRKSKKKFSNYVTPMAQKKGYIFCKGIMLTKEIKFKNE